MRKALGCRDSKRCASDIHTDPTVLSVESKENVCLVEKSNHEEFPN